MKETHWTGSWTGALTNVGDNCDGPHFIKSRKFLEVKELQIT
jgi:hypothetical protein